MRRLSTILVTLVAILALAVTTALAVGPTSVTRTGGLHFVGNPDVSIRTSGSGANLAVFLRGTGEVAGAGTTAGATLTADVEVVRGCINRGAKGQEPSGLQRSFEGVTGSVTFQTRQGRGSFVVDTSAISAAGFACPDRMTPTLVSVTFTNIVLTVTSQTGTTTATFPNLSWP